MDPPRPPWRWGVSASVSSVYCGAGEEPVFKSVCSSFNAPAAPSRGQRGFYVFFFPLLSAEAARVVKSQRRDSRGPPMILRAVLLILWSRFLSVWVQLAYQTVMPYVSRLSTEKKQQKIVGSSSFRMFLLATLRKWGRRWAFAVVFAVHMRSAETTVVGNLNVWTLSIQSPLIRRLPGPVLCFLKARMISFVLVVFRARVFNWEPRC